MLREMPYTANLLYMKFHLFPSVYRSGNALAYTPTYLNCASMTSTFVNDKTHSSTQLITASNFILTMTDRVMVELEGGTCCTACVSATSCFHQLCESGVQLYKISIFGLISVLYFSVHS